MTHVDQLLLDTPGIKSLRRERSGRAEARPLQWGFRPLFQRRGRASARP